MLLAVLPGLGSAFLLTADKSDYDLILRRAIVVTLVIAGAIGWLPFGDHIPLKLWLLALAGLSLLGTPAVASMIRSAISVRLVPGSRLPHITAFIVLAVFAFVLSVHPIVDWDAINYYLVGAMDAVANGHYTSHLSALVEITPGSTNTLPPALPALYALSITAGQILHYAPDASIRFVPFVYIVGIWLASRRIASYFMTRPWAEAAGVLSLIIPGVLTVVVAVPLLLDLAFTFLALQLIDEIRQEEGASPFLIGLTAGALAIEKIDGLPFAILAFIASGLTLVRGRIRLLVAAAVALSLPLTAFALKLLSKAPVPATFLAIATTAIVFVSATMRQPTRSLHARWAPFLSFLVIGFLPGIFQAAKLTALTGSPAAYYLPSLATHQSVLWHHAVDLIARSQIYAQTLAPGIPSNFGFGLLLWWGFAPPMMLGLLWGLIHALRNRAALLAVIGIFAIVELAFLTIFGLDDFRHLLPILPVIAIVATYGFSTMPGSTNRCVLYFCLCLLASVPFAWVGQQRFFVPPIGFLSYVRIDEWHALSTQALIEIALYIVALAAVGAAIFALRIRNASAIRWRRPLLILTATVIICGWFEPVIATAVSPGFSAQQELVLEQQDGQYLPALSNVLSKHRGNTVLTFGSFGTTWFSRATLRHAELTDASDLETLIPCFRRIGLRCAAAIGAHSAILPAEGTDGYAALQRLLHLARLEELNKAYSTQVSYRRRVGLWVVLRPRAERGW